MNKARRAAIAELVTKLDELRGDLESIRDKEQEAFDNMPESLQGSERGTDSENAIETLTNALDSIQEACNGMEELS
jgi:phage shock protein A